jgi:APA family basic amino acid/polyamine antiporter
MPGNQRKYKKEIAMSDVSLFVRKASGLVRAWSVFDAFIYATFSINLITLGLFIFSYCYYLQGSLISGVVIGAIFTIFEVIVYASLISAMPRAGGDYVWQSRILNRAIGFVLSVTGWWFILWLWTPLYGQMLTYEVYTPLLAIAGLKDAALWFTTTSMGQFVGMLSVCLIVFIYIAIGMKWYARVQKFCFWGGVVGLLIVFLLLLFGNNATFISNFNALAPRFGAVGGADIYAQTMQAGQDAGTVAGPLFPLALGASILLVPMLTFFNLWPNWGSTLYGEVRGASDYKRNFLGMFMAIVVTTLGAVIFFLLIGKTIGWEFYNNANGAFWNSTWGYTTTPPPLPIWPYPALFAAFLVKSPALMFVIVLLMSLWWFGWSGTLFLSSTRVIFAAAIDRMLPEWVSKIEPRTKTPLNALLLMVIPSAIISYLYAFKVFNFNTLALDATVVIAITFLGSTIAGIVMPWRAKDVFDGSPIAKYKVPTWLGWIVTALYTIFSIYLIYLSFKNATTIIGGLGTLNPDGLTWFVVILLGVLTIVNAVILLWVLYQVIKGVTSSKSMPLITLAGLIFLGFLDWLLVVWFWDPAVLPEALPAVGTYGIGWSNVSSMIFMLFNYIVAGAIYFGFSAYRRQQGIQIEKVYKEIPVE